MYPDHVLQESDVADVQHMPERDQRMSPRRFPRHYRICVLLVLTLFGLHLLAAGSGAGSGESLSRQRIASSQTGLVTRTRYSASDRFGSWSSLRRKCKRKRSSGGVSQPVGCHLLVAERCPVDGTASHGCAATCDRGHHAQPAQHLDADATRRHVSEPDGDHLVEMPSLWWSISPWPASSLSAAIMSWWVATWACPTPNWRSSCRDSCWPTVRRTSACFSWACSSTWKMH